MINPSKNSKMRLILALFLALLMLPLALGVAEVQDNSISVEDVGDTCTDIICEDIPCTELDGCGDDITEDEPREQTSSGGHGGDSSSLTKQNVISYNECYTGLWGKIRPMAIGGTFNLLVLLDIFGSPDYAICGSDFWFGQLKPMFFDNTFS